MNIEVCPRCGDTLAVRRKLIMIDEAWVPGPGKDPRKPIFHPCASTTSRRNISSQSRLSNSWTGTSATSAKQGLFQRAPPMTLEGPTIVDNHACIAQLQVQADRWGCAWLM